MATKPFDKLKKFKEQYDEIEDKWGEQDIGLAQRQDRINQSRARFEESNGPAIGMDDTYFSSDEEDY